MTIEESKLNLEWPYPTNMDSGSITFPAGDTINSGDAVTVTRFELKWWQRFLMWLFPRQFNYYETVYAYSMNNASEGDIVGVTII